MILSLIIGKRWALFGIIDLAFGTLVFCANIKTN